jgi:Tol biopolymer transport system component
MRRDVVIVVLTMMLWIPGLAANTSGAQDLADEVRQLPERIVYESYRTGNWDLFASAPDGSNVVNLTATPECHELYPHVSPDGTKICFLADEGSGDAKSRNIYYMNRDGSGRTLVTRNGRDPCWNGDGTQIAFLPGEFAAYTLKDFATKGLVIHDLASGRNMPHPNRDLHHLYNLCWSPDGEWFVATVHGGMGYRHAILAIEAHGQRVVDLRIPGCRPDLSPDGRRIAWGASDFVLRVAEIDWSGPRVENSRDLISSQKPIEVYHVDWSPDGKYVAFSRGPAHKRLGPAPEMVGAQAADWNICVASAETPNRWLQFTQDGASNKEPDWAPLEKKQP